MPSVFARWSGQCRDPEVRQELCSRLSDIAWSQRILMEARASPIDIRAYNHTLCGSVAVHVDLLPDSAIHRMALDEDSFSTRETLDVYGIEFSLPTIYPDENRASFLFVVDDDPNLDGILVHVAQRTRPSVIARLNVAHRRDPQSGRVEIAIEGDRNTKQERDAVAAADWALVTPRIHLRYSFESWLDDLLGWIKHFYMPDLWFWRYEGLPGYGRFRPFSTKDEALRDDLFNRLRIAEEIFPAE
jgi:hypothetical protein